MNAHSGGGQPAAKPTMDMWAIYDRPSDYPDGFIARRWIIGAGVATPTSDILLASDVDALRVIFRAEGRIVFVDGRDDPCIVESWI